ncbi:unnamed protein product [Protopolystoma xenopodis]|uniref:Uncharacterized protein n=1 Tax=Protopolystoma xenopodis TaxID=117903 RepID=A0A3S5CUI2_9PLAT|nr:unnamed protein product [Protopolystoma xenopodis]
MYLNCRARLALSISIHIARTIFIYFSSLPPVLFFISITGCELSGLTSSVGGLSLHEATEGTAVGQQGIRYEEIRSFVDLYRQLVGASCHESLDQIGGEDEGTEQNQETAKNEHEGIHSDRLIPSMTTNMANGVLSPGIAPLRRLKIQTMLGIDQLEADRAAVQRHLASIECACQAARDLLSGSEAASMPLLDSMISKAPKNSVSLSSSPISFSASSSNFKRSQLKKSTTQVDEAQYFQPGPLRVAQSFDRKVTLDSKDVRLEPVMETDASLAISSCSSLSFSDSSALPFPSCYSGRPGAVGKVPSVPNPSEREISSTNNSWSQRSTERATPRAVNPETDSVLKDSPARAASIADCVVLPSPILGTTTVVAAHEESGTSEAKVIKAGRRSRGLAAKRISQKATSNDAPTWQN